MNSDENARSQVPAPLRGIRVVEFTHMVMGPAVGAILVELGADLRYATNSQRVAARDTLLPRVRTLFKSYAKADLVARLERTGLPFAPIGKPEDLFDDPHLLASGGLGDVTLEDGTPTKLPLLPVELDGHRPTQGGHLPRPGQHTREVLEALGLTGEAINSLAGARAIQ